MREKVSRFLLPSCSPFLFAKLSVEPETWFMPETEEKKKRQKKKDKDKKRKDNPT